MSPSKTIQMCVPTQQSPTTLVVALDTTVLKNYFAKDAFSVSFMSACEEIKRTIIP